MNITATKYIEFKTHSKGWLLKLIDETVDKEDREKIE